MSADGAGGGDGDTNGSGASEWQPYDGAAFESSAEKGACPICTVEFSADDGCQALTYACCDKVRAPRGGGGHAHACCASRVPAARNPPFRITAAPSM